MLPYKSIIHLDKTTKTSLYIQLSNELIQKISSGLISTGTRLPGGRKLGELLGISRKTVILAYEELEAQGWIEIKPAKGAFVCKNLPIIKHRKLVFGEATTDHLTETRFKLNNRLDFLDYYIQPPTDKIKLTIDTGYPDVRLAPNKQLAQAYHHVLNSKQDQKLLNYASNFRGHPNLKKEILKNLSETRGMKLKQSNIMITRGSLMAFTSIFQILLEKGDKVVVGDVSFKVANNIIKIAGGKIVEVPVDDHGLDIEKLRQVCKKTKIRAVFVMPHHHHPTTVSLSCERRIELRNLAAEYGFAIVEDDYDYDFHYASSPILPMASADQDGVVIYVGSFSKNVAPGLRTGFVVAPENFINELSRFSRFMDVHGNIAIEKSLAILMNEGIIRRHLKKSLKAYRIRRDLFCDLLQRELGDVVDFKIPEGGLAAWVNFQADHPLQELRQKCLDNGLLISRTVFQNGQKETLNSIRMGFASLNEEEIVQSIKLLKNSL